jgi:ABC-type phosphate transport system substrate-binding protein
MNRRHRARRLTALAACVGTSAALAVLGSASAAFAENTDTCTTIYGAGSSLQKVAQGNQGGFSNETSITESVAAGVTRIKVSNASVYSAGTKVAISVGTANVEEIKIVSFEGNTLVLETATTKSHSAGDVVGIKLTGVFLNDWAGTYVISGSTLGCSSRPQAAYYSSSSGVGLNEFGNTTGVINKAEDKQADADTSSPCKESGPQVEGHFVGGCLDGYVASDVPPNAGELGEARVAAGALNLNELTLPVAQAPVAALLSLPAKCSVPTETALDVTNETLDQAWLGTIPAGGSDPHGGSYPANTWGALLAKISEHEEGGAITVTDEGTAGNGCETPITREVRSSHSGTTYAFKSYLAQVDPNEWGNFVNDGDEWPAATSNSFGGHNNESGGEEAHHTAGNPGSIGYANTADAASASNGGYTAAATASTTEGSVSHQILWAQVQNNGTHAAGSKFADPLGSAHSTIANCDSTTLVPSEEGAAYSATDSWYGVVASDPNAAVDTGTSTDYSVCALTYVLTWEHETPPNLFGNTPGLGEAGLIGTTVHDYLEFVIREGQTDIQGNDFTSVPTPLLAKMKAIVNLVRST